MIESITNFKNALKQNTYADSVIVSAISYHIVKAKSVNSETLEETVFNELDERFRTNQKNIEDLFLNRTCFMTALWGSTLYKGKQRGLSPRGIALEFITKLTEELNSLAEHHIEVYESLEANV